MNDDALPPRLQSLDALRGADILIIAGVDTLVYHLAPLFPHSGMMQTLRAQMGHVDWAGLTAYDLVFPLFIFLAGVSLFLSQSRQREWSIPRRIAKLYRRAALLLVLGWAINGDISFHLSTMRFASVLGLIGLAGAFAGSIALLWSGRVGGCLCSAAILVAGVGLAQHLCGDYTPGGCLNARADALLCPGRLHLGCLDPEGPLCLISATGLCLVGYAAGAILRHPSRRARVLMLSACGLLCLALAAPLPCIKNMWTAGFTLTAAGAGCLLLLLFHLLLDCLPASARGLCIWAFPLRVAGANALFLYLFTHLFNLQALAARLSCGLWGALLPAEALPTAYAATALLLAWLPAYYLYLHRLCIKL